MNDNVSPFAEQANAYYQDLLRPVFAGRKFLIAAQIAAAVGLGGLARQLTRLGAERPFLLAGSEGTGALPTPEEAELRVLGIQSTDVLEDFRSLRHTLLNLPPDVRRDLDAWDPAGTARFIFASPLADSVDVAGRKAYAGRHPTWAALEDKVLIDSFWDAVGVRRAPSRIVAADYDALRSATDELDRGLGTVWAADARDGTHGGGMGLRWVRHADDGRESFASLRRMADRIRVMPFLEGVPASIHGIVFPDAVAVFRPVEMVVLRPKAGDRLHYAGCATAFDPLPDDRKTMRALAYHVGVALREAVDYRGPFGIDGILAEDGYLPTELNARAGGAMGRPLAQGNDLPLTPLCLAVTAGERLDYRPDLLEQTVVASADTHRTCMGWSVTALRVAENRMFDVLRDGDEYRECLPGEEPHGTLQAGPGPVGGFVRFVLEPERIELGRSAAPEVVRAFRFADRALGTDFGEFDVASDVRR
ncbi:MAG: hypothetical protein OXH15_02500 [Gammaproteobacteria bacterium]|nr:hypothetical protein [Gammaproteobacteria bacterium]